MTCFYKTISSSERFEKKIHHKMYMYFPTVLWFHVGSMLDSVVVYGGPTLCQHGIYAPYLFVHVQTLTMWLGYNPLPSQRQKSLKVGTSVWQTVIATLLGADQVIHEKGGGGYEFWKFRGKRLLVISFDNIPVGLRKTLFASPHCSVICENKTCFGKVKHT